MHSSAKSKQKGKTVYNALLGQMSICYSETFTNLPGI